MLAKIQTEVGLADYLFFFATHYHHCIPFPLFLTGISVGLE